MKDGSGDAMDADVLVVGAGPTGLTVAGDLARAGRSVVVLEHRPQAAPTNRACALLGPTLELLAARGLAEDLVVQGNRIAAVRLPTGDIDLSRLPTRYPFILVTPQPNLDRALADFATGQGARLVRGAEAVGIVRDLHGVTVIARAGTGSNGATRCWRARYMVAADGSRSAVRALLGLPFAGDRLPVRVTVAEVQLVRAPDPGALILRPAGDGFVLLVPYSSRGGVSWHQAVIGVCDRGGGPADPLPESAIGDRLQQLAPDVELAGVGSRECVVVQERQVPQYRVGRVLLAGDAAHSHVPLIGPGLNSGMHDAENLARKLAAVLAGADERTLDRYHDERHPVARRLQRQTKLMLGEPASRRNLPFRTRIRQAPTSADLDLVLGTPRGGLADDRCR